MDFSEKTEKEKLDEEFQIIQEKLEELRQEEKKKAAKYNAPLSERPSDQFLETHQGKLKTDFELIQEAIKYGEQEYLRRQESENKRLQAEQNNRLTDEQHSQLNQENKTNKAKTIDKKKADQIRKMFNEKIKKERALNKDKERGVDR